MVFRDPTFDRLCDLGRTLDRDFVIHKTAGHLVDGTHGSNRNVPLNLFDQAVMKLDIALMSSQHAGEAGT